MPAVSDDSPKGVGEQELGLLTGWTSPDIGRFAKVLEEIDYFADVWALLYEHRVGPEIRARDNRVWYLLDLAHTRVPEVALSSAPATPLSSWAVVAPRGRT
jgi:hypothetical protein